MSFCETLPNCRRMSCAMPACEHQKPEPHIIVGICDGYMYPKNWGVCMNCGKLSTDHTEQEPHTVEGICDGFEYDPGISEQMFVGGGGRFGGGGATGGW